MPYTESQKKASMKYMKEKTDDIRLRVPKGLKEKYLQEAEARGISMTKFIIQCVEKELGAMTQIQEYDVPRVGGDDP